MFHGVSLFRCNDREAELALRRDLRSEDDFRAGLRELREELEVRARGRHARRRGHIVARRTRCLSPHPGTDTSEVFDITGAGDTVIAVLTMALAAGASLLDAARLANAAAGVVVRKWGNALITPTELAEAISAMSDEQ